MEPRLPIGRFQVAGLTRYEPANQNVVSDTVSDSQTTDQYKHGEPPYYQCLIDYYKEMILEIKLHDEAIFLTTSTCIHFVSVVSSAPWLVKGTISDFRWKIFQPASTRPLAKLRQLKIPLPSTCLPSNARYLYYVWQSSLRLSRSAPIYSLL